jgi:hypothetical protein
LSGIFGELFGEPFKADDNFFLAHEDFRELMDAEEEEDDDDTVPNEETEEFVDGGWE